MSSCKAALSIAIPNPIVRTTTPNHVAREIYRTTNGEGETAASLGARPPRGAFHCGCLAALCTYRRESDRHDLAGGIRCTGGFTDVVSITTMRRRVDPVLWSNSAGSTRDLAR
jgi:hypothetical protein